MHELRVILVEPLYSGNIGSTARVMANFGFSSLYLINPRCEIDEFARQMASRAQNTLDEIKICDSIQDAVKDVHLVCAATSQERLRHPIQPVHMSVPEIISHEKIAILFGREEKGLKTEELSLASVLLNIPSSKGYPSFNLAMSVGLICYEFHKNSSEKSGSPPQSAERQYYDAMYHKLENLLLRNEYCTKTELPKKMIRIRRIFDKAGLDKREIKILMGLFKTLGE